MPSEETPAVAVASGVFQTYIGPADCRSNGFVTLLGDGNGVVRERSITR